MPQDWTMPPVVGGPTPFGVTEQQRQGLINVRMDAFRKLREEIEANTQMTPEQKEFALAAEARNAGLPYPTPSLALGAPSVTKADRRLQKLSDKAIADAAKAQESQAKVFDQQREQQEAAAQQGRERAQEAVAFAQEQQRLVEEQAFDKRHADAERQGLLDAEIQKHKTLQSQIETGEINPDRVWENMGTGQKIGLALASAAMALGASMTGRGDPAQGIKMIQHIIDRDVAAQKADLAGKRAAFTAQANIIGAMRDAYGDERAAEAATRALQWKAVEAKAAEMEARAQNSAMKEQFGALRVQAEQQRVAHETAMSAALNDRLLDIEKTRVPLAAQRDTLAVKRAQESAQAQPGGKQLTEGTVKELSAVSAQIQHVDQLESAFKSKTGPMSFIAKQFPGTDADDYESARALFVRRLINAITGAGVSQAEAEGIAGLVPSAATWDARAEDKFAALRDELRLVFENKTSALRTSGYDTSGLELSAPIRSTSTGYKVR